MDDFVKTSKEDAEYYKWVGIIERHPETYNGGHISDLPLIPERLLPRLAEKFEFIKEYIKRKDNDEYPTYGEYFEDE